MNSPLITDPFFYLIAAPAVLLGVSKSGFGLGFGSADWRNFVTSLALLPLAPLGGIWVCAWR
jgi:hypothetical protein